jgi:hypothetical protein
VRSWVLGVALLLLTGCGAQTPSPPDYRTQTELTLSTALSSVATVQLAVEQLHAGNLMSSYAEVMVTSSVDALDSQASSYTSLDPPRTSQALFDKASSILDEAEGLLVEARIAVSRNDTGTYAGLAGKLRKLADDLDRLDQRLQ